MKLENDTEMMSSHVMWSNKMVYHPDIIKFITAKQEEGRIANANISVIVDDKFMRAVENDETYWTEFEGVKYSEYSARAIFSMIIEGMWKNGEPRKYWVA